MASQAQLRQQLANYDAAIAAIRTQLQRASFVPGETARLDTALRQLESQRRQTVTQLNNLTRASNPPNPQVNNPAPVPPPPPLTTQPTAADNPPNPQVPVPNANAEPATGSVTVEAAPVADDAAVNRNEQLANIDDTVFIETEGGLRVLPNEVTITDINTDPQDGLVEFVAGGQRIVDPEATEFEITEGGLRVLPEDVPSETEIEDGAIVEFTASGERIIDADGFVITEGGLRVLPEDIDQEVDTEGSDLVREPTAADVEEAAIAQGLLDQARQQASVAAMRKANGTAVGDGDWRVRLRLAPNSYYLYKANEPGILAPLQLTDGVIFPYTPRIDITYSADYNPSDLVHNNYRSYFYKGSKVGEIVMNADFTAQDTKEADYLLAVIHFFKSCTKMFYGQDDERGAPPPLVFLSGLGEFQFNEHPCVISQFNYSLPNDVDYIRARGRQSTDSGVTQGGNGLMFQRTLSGAPISSYSLSSIWARLTGANLPRGGINIPPAPPNLGLSSPTYVPTKISMSLTLLPMQTRKQVSNQFSLEKYANGNLLRGGFW